MSPTSFSNALSSAGSLCIFFIVHYVDSGPAFCQLEADWIFGSCALLLAEMNRS